MYVRDVYVDVDVCARVQIVEQRMCVCALPHCFAGHVYVSVHMCALPIKPRIDRQAH